MAENPMLDAWRESAKFWARYNDTIRTMFTPLTEALVEAAGIHAGQHVLDVAGGPGEPSLTIAGIVGPQGSVTHTDAVPEMVETARREAERRGLTNIQFRESRAESLPFADDSFDVAVCRLGVMLFADPPAGIREMLRVTKPGGRVAFAVWHKSELNPFCYRVSDVIDRYIESPAVEPDAPGAFRFAEVGKLAQVLSAAGATDVDERVFHFNIAAPIAPLEFWAMRSKMSDTLRDKLDKLPATEQAAVASEIEQAVKEFFPANEMSFPAQMIIASGRVAAD